MTRPHLLPAVLLLSLTCSAASLAEEPEPLYAGKPLPKAASVTRMVISKGKNRLEAWQGKRLLKVYKVVVGKGGEGPKRYQGDNRTPEGRYHIYGRHRSKKFKLFLGVSYPNVADRRRYRRLKKKGKVPAGRGIGSAIGIHGEKKGFRWLPHKIVNWTEGCIALDDDEIVELYRAVKKRAEVVIGP